MIEKRKKERRKREKEREREKERNRSELRSCASMSLKHFFMKVEKGQQKKQVPEREMNHPQP